MSLPALVQGGFWRHPKLYDLAERLGVERAHAGGLLVSMWCWSHEYHPDGDLSKTPPSLLAEACGWRGDVRKLAAALRESGWVDPDGRVHEFLEHQGKAARRRAANRERMRTERAHHAHKKNTPSPCPSPLPLPLPLPFPEALTAKDSCAEPAAAPASAPHEDAVLEFPTAGKTRSWNLYPSKVQEYQSTFPGVDVVAECRRALQWLRDNPARKKTARGIPKFLGSWLGRAQDRGPTTRPPASPPPSRTDDLPVLRPPQVDPVLDGVRDLLGEVPHA